MLFFFFFLILYSLTIKVSLFFSSLLNSRQSLPVPMTEFLKFLSKFHCGWEIGLCVLSPNVMPVKGGTFSLENFIDR